MTGNIVICAGLFRSINTFPVIRNNILRLMVLRYAFQTSRLFSFRIRKYSLMNRCRTGWDHSIESPASFNCLQSWTTRAINFPRSSVSPAITSFIPMHLQTSQLSRRPIPLHALSKRPFGATSKSIRTRRYPYSRTEYRSAPHSSGRCNPPSRSECESTTTGSSCNEPR